MRRFLIAALLAVAPAPALARDPDNAEVELAEMAKDVADVLAKAGQKEVRMGWFTGDGDIPSSFGSEIKRVLGNEFGKLKVKVNPNALVEVKGSYAPATEDPSLPGSKLMFIRVNVELVNTKTRLPLPNVRVASRAVYGNEDLGRAFAPSVSLAPDGAFDTRNQSFKLAIQNPKVTIAGPLVKSPARDTPFAAEMLVVATADAPDPVAGRRAEDKDGLAFVKVAENEFYRIRVYNNAPFDAAVRLSVDGLDQFVFADADYRDKDGRPEFQYMIVPAGKSTVIRGWFRNLKQADAFVITSYSKSAAAELNAPQAKTGQVCVQFYAAWDKDENKPKDETSKDASTGRGEPVDVNLRRVKYQIGAQRDQVSIRYAK